MRYSLAVTPANYLLFACHFINEGSQLTQGYRYLNWHHWGGKEAATGKGELQKAAAPVESKTLGELVDKAKTELKK